MEVVTMSLPNMSRYKFTPSSLEGKDTGYMRRQYAYLRSVLNKRADRIAAKGFSEYEYGQRLPAASTISDADIKAALLDASQRARSPETFSRGFEERLEARIEGLQRAGYENVTRENVAEFWQFMKHQRSKMSITIYDSAIVAQTYDMARSRGISAATLERNFKSFMTSRDRMERLYDAIESFELPAGRKRMSSTEIRKRL